MGANLFSFSLLDFNFHKASNKHSEPRYPWLSLKKKTLRKDSHIFSYLSCHTETSLFHGRENELAAMDSWINDDEPVSIRFVTGPGGSGKTRLAVEFSEHHLSKEWAAGFISLSNIENKVFRPKKDFSLGVKGTLLIIDYPEQHFDQVDILFRELCELDPGRTKLRVLFLTRSGQEEWEKRILRCNATDLTGRSFINLSPDVTPLSPEIGRDIINSAQEAIGNLERYASDDQLRPFNETIVADWMSENELHRLPLFLVAAGVHSAMSPKEDALSYSGHELVEALVNREWARLSNTSKDLKAEENTLPRLVALATMSNGLAWQELRNNERIRDLCNIPPKWEVKEQLRESGWLNENAFEPITPDIVGAGFVVKVLENEEENAQELTWEAIRLTPATTIMILGRMSHDAKYTLKMSRTPIDWLSESARQNIERCKKLKFVTLTSQPYTLNELCISVGKGLLKISATKEDKALYLNNLSNALAKAGRIRSSLAMIKDTVKITRQLATDNPGKFDKNLAAMLNNLGNRLGDCGHFKDAQKALNEAIDIYRQISIENPTALLPELAITLKNLSAQLIHPEEINAAINALKESVDILRQASKTQPIKYEEELASSLHSLATNLLNAGKTEKALNLVLESTEIYERLSIKTPEKHLFPLASSLTSSGNILCELGDLDGALMATKRALEINRKLATSGIVRFQEELAGSLKNISLLFMQINNLSEALRFAKEAEAICRQLANKENPLSQINLAQILGVLAILHIRFNKYAESKQYFSEAIITIENCLTLHPETYIDDLYGYLVDQHALL